MATVTEITLPRIALLLLLTEWARHQIEFGPGFLSLPREIHSGSDKWEVHYRSYNQMSPREGTDYHVEEGVRFKIESGEKTLIPFSDMGWKAPEPMIFLECVNSGQMGSFMQAKQDVGKLALRLAGENTLINSLLRNKKNLSSGPLPDMRSVEQITTRLEDLTAVREQTIVMLNEAKEIAASPPQSRSWLLKADLSGCRFIVEDEHAPL